MFLWCPCYSGKTVSNIEQFGQYPLQVNGFNNLDECLEGAMVEGDIESLYCDRTIPSGREVSITVSMETGQDPLSFDADYEYKFFSSTAMVF